MGPQQIIADPFVGKFGAMACPCEILLDTADPVLGAEALDTARREAERIENKFSRYRSGNIVHRINTARGAKIGVDDETAGLLDYAASCYEISDGCFDITTGALRKGANPAFVGWNNVLWSRPWITLPENFEIDFGGIGKEYAADRILALLRERYSVSALVNLGGDIAAAGERLWSVGVEDPSRPGGILRTVYLRAGGIATSGTTKRGGHILNPKTGKPIEQAPLSVTVAARTCTEAGLWSTLGMLQGANAETFLKEQALEFWCER
jgi:FAD:protein FMN transferase